MKRKTDLAPVIEDSDQQLAQVIPIRTETLLCQYPIHQLSKASEPLQVQLTKENERGKVVTVWEVSANSKYGEPGILAYKLDTLFINRLIDDLRPNIPEVIRLGSLRDICEELGTERNTATVKKALYQNAFAAITAKLEYTGNDGVKRKFEFGSTRYGVIFTGETLPSGEKASAVYIVLNPIFREVLRHAKTRPLDYEYLKGLPPSSQRLYELLSFQIFAALKNGNPRANYLYSELCQRAPLTRYYEWNLAKKQLYKLHQPHKQSGYIKSVEFEETHDESGAIDWLMKYTPGAKAKREFRAFTERRREAVRPMPRLVETPKVVVPAPVELTKECVSLIAQLQAFGVTEKKATELVTAHQAAAEREVEAFPHRNRSVMKDPAAWLIRAIESGDYSQPPKLQAKRTQRAAEKKEQEREAREAKYRPLYFAEYLEPFSANLSALNTEAFEVYQKRCEQMDLNFSHWAQEDRERFKVWDLELMARDWPDLQLIRFDDWLLSEHPEAFTD